MINYNLLSILQSPDDQTPIQPNLISEGGNKYELTESGILILHPKYSRLSETIYSSNIFERWNSIINDRIRYYTGKQSIAGLVANWGYRNICHFNNRPKGEWLLDIGCGDGAHVAYLNDRSTYIGIDRNIERLEILKKNYPEATVIYGDAALLPFKTGSLKYVFSSNTFEHIWYLKDAVMELFRCISKDGQAIIVIPTEGGLWNLGRKLISKPYFKKKYPYIDFDFISSVEHCNEANQIIHTLKTFFNLRKKFVPIRVLSIFMNLFIELYCKPKDDLNLLKI